MGLVIIYEDQIERIPFLRSVTSLEYELTRLIKKMVNPEGKKVIGIIKGHGSYSLDKELAILKQLLQDYEVKSITLKKASDLKRPKDSKKPKGDKVDIDTVAIFGPTKDFSKAQLYLLDQYLLLFHH